MGKLEQQLLEQVLEMVHGDERRVPNVVFSVVERACLKSENRKHEMRSSLERLAREALKEASKKKK